MKKSARCDRAARVLAGRPPRTAAGCAAGEHAGYLGKITRHRFNPFGDR